MADRKPRPDYPTYAALDWARFRRVMIWMGVAAAVAIVVSLIFLETEYGPLSWVTIVATVFGLAATIMLAALLMGLIFLSSASGYDETVDDLPRQTQDRRRFQGDAGPGHRQD